MNLTLSPSTLISAQHITHALGWTLLHFLWQGALVALLLACVLSLLNERSPQPRYLAACTALLLMVAAPIVTFTRILASTRLANHATIILIPFETVTAIDGPGPSQPLLERLAATFDHAMPAILALWFAGTLLLSARLCIGLIIARRMQTLCTQPAPRDLVAAFHRLTHRIGISRPVRLLNSALVQVPTVIGWLRPVVLIPLGCLAGLSSQQVEAILAHELAHIRRHDYLISVLQSIVEALLFYHPAVWWVSRRIRIEREHCCDDLAVQLNGDPLLYARALSLLAEQSLTLPTIALGANGGILTMRIKRLLTPKENPAASQLAALTLLAAVLAGTAICITTAAHAQSTAHPTNTQSTPTPQRPLIAALFAPDENPAAQSATKPVAAKPDTVNSIVLTPPTTAALSSVFRQWLNQDAAYIITPAERATFLQLPDDAARDAFITQFWLTRDAPGATPYSFRAQHYSRIAYANQHFTTGNTPGWKTDRGRMYILNGDASSIAADTHDPYIKNISPWLNSDMYPASKPITPATPTGTPHEIPLAKPASKPVSYALVAALPPQDPPTSSAPVRVASGVMAGEILSPHAQPVYPPIAKAAHVQGAVVLHAIISKNGDVEDLQIISGAQMLRASALEAVGQWKYKPYLLNGQPTEVETTITVNFTFGDEDERTDSGVVARALGNGISAPQVIHQINPEFSQAARDATKAGDFHGGKVLVRLIVDEQGDPQKVRVIRGVGFGLDEEAVNAVEQYKFKPALENGQPVPVAINIEVNFQTF